MKARKYAIVSFVLWSIIIAFGLYSNRKGGEYKAINENEITALKGTLANFPKISTGKSGSSVTIKLNEHPRFSFLVRGVNFNAFNTAFVSEVKTGDSIYLYILTDEYETKIQKKRKPSLYNRIFNYNYKFIKPFAIHSNDKYYLKLENTNMEIERDRGMGFWFFSIGAFIFLIYSILYWTGTIRRFANWWNRIQPG